MAKFTQIVIDHRFLKNLCPFDIELAQLLTLSTSFDVPTRNKKAIISHMNRQSDFEKDTCDRCRAIEEL